MNDRDLATEGVVGNDAHWLERTLEMAERRECPFHGPPSIPLERLHEAARRAQASPGRTFNARPQWTSVNRWGFPDCVSFSVFDELPGLAHSRITQVVIASQSRYRIHAFVNLIAGLRGIRATLDETFRMSQSYEAVPIAGATAYFVGLAAIPGSRAGL